MKTIEVVAAIVVNDWEILCAQRGKNLPMLSIMYIFTLKALIDQPSKRIQTTFVLSLYSLNFFAF